MGLLFLFFNLPNSSSVNIALLNYAIQHHVQLNRIAIAHRTSGFRCLYRTGQFRWQI